MNQVENKKPAIGKLLIYVTGGIGIGLTLICSSFVAPALRKYCLPYVPATTTQIRNVMSLIPENTSGKLLDVGSGDGRIVISIASKSQIECHGVELNLWLCWFSRLMAIKNNVRKTAIFYRGDLWKFNVSTYDHIVIFGVDQMMREMERKILREAKPGATIIACRFPLPTLEPIKLVGQGVDTVWMYRTR